MRKKRESAAKNALYAAAIAVVVLGAVVAICLKKGLIIREETFDSPINGEILRQRRGALDYEFVLVGHSYGSQNLSVYPSASLLANLDFFNGKSVSFVVLLGDMLRFVRQGDIEAFKRSFGRKVKKPIFNAIGNHDNGDRSLYLSSFGKRTFYSFSYGTERFIVLDSERDDGRLRGDQLDFLLSEIRSAAENPGIRNLFIFSHRLLWAIGNPPVDSILPHVNGPDIHRPTADDFSRLILPELGKFTGKRAYLAAGDIGLGWSFPVFYHEDSARPITYLATGIGDLTADQAVLVRVKKGKVEFDLVSLTGFHITGRDGKIHGIDYFNVGFWYDYFKEMEKRKKASRPKAQ